MRREQIVADQAYGSAEQQSDAEWAASLTVADVDTILNRCVQQRDFTGLAAGLRLMAVKDPRRAEEWMDTLRLGVALGQARHGTETRGG
jgi:3-keto-L-gulonate-6-phosphate decarboxylase